jgi:hypothetical protein
MTSQAGAPKRFRFTLRSLLAAVTALSILLGIVTAVYRWQADKHKREAAKGWIVEVRGYTYHADAAKIESVEVQYYNDLRDWMRPVSDNMSLTEPVEAQYYDDLRPVFEQLKKQKP